MDIDTITIQRIIDCLGWHPGDCVGEYGPCSGCVLVRTQFNPLRESLERKLTAHIRSLLVEIQ